MDRKSARYILSYMKLIRTFLFGLIFVVPFFILEWFTTSGFAWGFPLTLFIFMWLNGALLVGVLLSVFEDFRKGGRSIKDIWLWLKILALIILSNAWITIVADQMPCLLGGRGC